CARAYPFDSW
nr:immunoglobulin heavy chain junction region [Mus musculus]